jgi:hypothetical protein
LHFIATKKKTFATVKRQSYFAKQERLTISYAIYYTTVGGIKFQMLKLALRKPAHVKKLAWH